MAAPGLSTALLLRPLPLSGRARIAPARGAVGSRPLGARRPPAPGLGRAAVRLTPSWAHAAAPSPAGDDTYAWSGEDDFTSLGDRKDEAPIPLPAISAPVRVVLVRHGQSTWNAAGRIQGASDVSELTPKGKEQASTSREMLSDAEFDVMFRSPLRRCTQTSDIIWGERAEPVVDMPVLREIDLYSFQGLVKAEGKARFGEEYRKWKEDVLNFEIDGHFPVRELWYRGSLGWQAILGAEVPPSVLVVAHNAVNQAMVATAIGLPASYFRRLTQSNAAVTVLDLKPSSSPGAPPRVTVDRLNSSPGSPLDAGLGVPRVVLVRHAGTEATEDGVLLGGQDEGISTKGRVQAQKLAEMMLDIKVGKVLTSPMQRAEETATSMAEILSLGLGGSPPVETVPGLGPMRLGAWEGRRAVDIAGSPPPAGCETPEEIYARAMEAFEGPVLNAAAEGGGQTVVVVGHAASLAAMICGALGLPAASFNTFHLDSAGVTVLEYPKGVDGEAVVRCANYTAHLGRWAVPATRGDGEDMACGIGGCF